MIENQSISSKQPQAPNLDDWKCAHPSYLKWSKKLTNLSSMLERVILVAGGLGVGSFMAVSTLSNDERYPLIVRKATLLAIPLVAVAWMLPCIVIASAIGIVSLPIFSIEAFSPKPLQPFNYMSEFLSNPEKVKKDFELGLIPRVFYEFTMQNAAEFQRITQLEETEEFHDAKCAFEERLKAINTPFDYKIENLKSDISKKSQLIDQLYLNKDKQKDSFREALADKGLKEIELHNLEQEKRAAKNKAFQEYEMAKDQIKLQTSEKLASLQAQFNEMQNKYYDIYLSGKNYTTQQFVIREKKLLQKLHLGENWTGEQLEILKRELRPQKVSLPLLPGEEQNNRTQLKAIAILNAMGRRK